MTNEEILKEEFDKLIEELRAKHLELGMKASGQWLETLENKTEGLTAEIVGQKYTEQLVWGRKPGKFPPLKAIEEWIKNKGIRAIEATLKISSLAFLIARKIAEEGTRYFRQGGTDLVDSVITPERIQEIINKVSIFNVSSFVLNISKEFKKL